WEPVGERGVSSLIRRLATEGTEFSEGNPFPESLCVPVSSVVCSSGLTGKNGDLDAPLNRTTISRTEFQNLQNFGLMKARMRLDGLAGEGQVILSPFGAGVRVAPCGNSAVDTLRSVVSVAAPF